MKSIYEPVFIIFQSDGMLYYVYGLATSFPKEYETKSCFDGQ